MKAQFLPEHPGAVAWVNGQMVRRGAVVEVDDATLRRVKGLVPVPVDAVADSLDAISAPTPHKPETPASPADVTPPKRGRKARGEA